MTADEVAPARAVWRLGDYHRFAREHMWEIGPVLVAACGISTGQRVLDVAAGSGNVAIRGAQAGAEFVASDITPENLEVGRKEADDGGRARGPRARLTLLLLARGLQVRTGPAMPGRATLCFVPSGPATT